MLQTLVGLCYILVFYEAICQKYSFFSLQEHFLGGKNMVVRTLGFPMYFRGFHALSFQLSCLRPQTSICEAFAFILSPFTFRLPYIDLY